MTTWPDHLDRVVLDQIDSTNREAERRAKAGIDRPIWLAARHQTAGRGRQGRAWESPGGNLYATYLEPTELPPSQAALIGFVAALAVADALIALAPNIDVQTKWPNDVLLNGAKASGILLERFSGKQNALAVGIGINLAEHPPQHVTRWRATSLRAETGSAPEFDTALLELASAFDRWRQVFQTAGFLAIRTAWLARAARLGAEIEVRLEKEVITGRFDDLDAEGGLVLDVGARQRRVAAGDVFFPGGS
ncbi:MAG: biotin--[acetyl-CoA-carboxylase] ligase [Pseudomonadota bacterium]